MNIGKYRTRGPVYAVYLPREEDYSATMLRSRIQQIQEWIGADRYYLMLEGVAFKIPAMGYLDTLYAKYNSFIYKIDDVFKAASAEDFLRDHELIDLIDSSEVDL